MNAQPDIRRLRRWVTEDRGVNHLLLACAEHRDLSSWMDVESGLPDANVVYRFDRCVASLPVAVLLELCASGARVVTALLDGCADPTASRRLIDQAQELLAACGRDERCGGTECRPLATQSSKGGSERRMYLTAATVPLSRRRLFGLGQEPVTPAPSDRARTVAVLHELTDGRPLSRALTELPSGARRLDAGSCAGSGVCVKACPQDALSLERTVLADSDGPAPSTGPAGRLEQFALSIDPTLCTDCGACLRLCPEQAIERDGEYTWSDLLRDASITLKAGTIHPCVRCGAPQSGTSGMCEVCSFRRANPFGSRMPPGWNAGSVSGSTR